MFQLVVVVLLPVALALGATPASAHGCHQGWQAGPGGLHRHGPKCERREGITDQRNQHDKAKQRRT
jgi:hypothetical protein